MIEVYRNRKKFKSQLLCNGTDDSLKIHFIHRYQTSNTGDKACGYYNYCLDLFSEYCCYVHDINSVDYDKIDNNDIVIIGGGGLLNALNEWNYTINKVAKRVKKAIIWSAGFNASSQIRLCCKIDFSLFSLVSIRDYNHPSHFRYVPCATCLRPEFDMKFNIKRRIGVVMHESKRSLPVDLHLYDSIDNSSDINEMLSFIGQSEIVVTNSYHAIYWATLMNKKCVLYGPTSEKFNYFQYTPIKYSGNITSDVEVECRHSDMLYEARKTTVGYVNNILNVIKS